MNDREDDGPIAILMVNSNKLRRGLTTAVKTLKLKGESAVMFGFRDGKLTVSFETGVTITSEAVGAWSGEARVPAALLPMIRRCIPAMQEECRVAVEDGMLKVGSSSVPCVWDGPSERIELGINPPEWLVLGLRAQYTTDNIRRSDLERIVEEAEAARDRRIATAHKALSAFGVEEVDIRRLIDEVVKRKKGRMEI